MEQKVYGPYSERDGTVWRVVVKTGRGTSAKKVPSIFSGPTAEAQARAEFRRLEVLFAKRSVNQVMEDYFTWLLEEERKPSSIVTNRYRLTGLFASVAAVPIDELTPDRCQELYNAYRVGRAVDTHQGVLALAKAMFEWARWSKLIPVSPWLDVKPRGRKKRGKEQLSKDDTRKLFAWLVDHAEADDRACGVLMALALGMRASEIIGVTSRHLDDGGRELQIRAGKTAAASRNVRLPEVLQTALARRAVSPLEPLLPYSRYWVREATFWACKQAGVPKVCAHALRGMYATATLDAGLDPRAIARSLGHTNISMTRSAYAATGAGDSVKVAQVVERLGPPTTGASPN